MKTSVLASLLIASVAIAQAQTAPRTVTLGGTSQYDGWANFNSTNFPGAGSFPGTGAWTNGPLGSNTAGSGDGTLRKAANGSGGGPYVASGSIYFAGFSSTPNTNGGQLALEDTTAISGLKTVVAQIEIGEAFGYDLYNRADAVLSYSYIPTGGSSTVNGSFSSTAFTSLLASVDTGETFPNPVTGDDEPLYRNLRAYQWDLSGIAGTVTSISVAFNGVQHAQLYSAQLDQSTAIHGTNVFSPAAVPEPTSMAALGLGALALLRRRRKA